MQRLLLYYSSGAPLSAVTILCVYVVSRSNNQEKCFQQNWEFAAYAITAGFFGGLIVLHGLAMLLGVEYGFDPWGVLIALAALGFGIFLCWLSYIAATGADCSVFSVAALPG